MNKHIMIPRNNRSIPKWITMCQEIEQDIQFLKNDIITERSYLGPYPLNEIEEKKWNKICKDNKYRAKTINAKIKKYNLKVPLIDKQKLYVPFDIIYDDILKNGIHSVLKQDPSKKISTMSAGRKIEECFNIFSIPVNSKQDVVRNAFLKLAKKYHPDSGSAEADINKFVTIENAFRILTQHITGKSSKQDVAQIVSDIRRTATQQRQYVSFEGADHDTPYQWKKQWEQTVGPLVDFTTHKLNKVVLNNKFLPEWIIMREKIEQDTQSLKNYIRTERSELGPHPLNKHDEKIWNKICKDSKYIAQTINAKINKYNSIVPLNDKQKRHVPLDSICDDILKNGTHSTVKQVIPKKISAMSAGRKIKECYNILDIPVNSKQHVVRNAFFELAEKYHPDSGSPQAHIDKFVTIENAFRILTQHSTGKSSEEDVAQIVNDIKKRSEHQRAQKEADKILEQRISEAVASENAPIKTEQHVPLYYGWVPEWITMCQEIKQDIQLLKNDILAERSYLGPHPLDDSDKKKWNITCKDNKYRAQIIHKKINKYNLIAPLIDKEKLDLQFDFICDDILKNGDHSAVKRVSLKKISTVSAARKIEECFNILGIPINSKHDVVRKAFFELTKKYHPESESAKADINKFVTIEIAFRILTQHITGKSNEEEVAQIVNDIKQTAKQRQILSIEDVCHDTPYHQYKEWEQRRAQRAANNVLEHGISEAVPSENALMEKRQNVPLNTVFVPKWITMCQEIEQDIQLLENDIITERSYLGPYPLNEIDEKKWNKICKDGENRAQTINEKINKYNVIVPLIDKQKHHVSLYYIYNDVLNNGTHSVVKQDPPMQISTPSAGRMIEECFNILGIPFNSGQDVVRNAFFELAKKYHPESGSAEADINKFVTIQNAFCILTQYNTGYCGEEEVAQIVNEIKQTVTQQHQCHSESVCHDTPYQWQKQWEQKLAPYVAFTAHKLNEVLVNNGLLPEWITMCQKIDQDIQLLKKYIRTERSYLGPHPLNEIEEKKWNEICDDGKNIAETINAKINKYNLIVPAMDKKKIHVPIDFICVDILTNGTHSVVKGVSTKSAERKIEECFNILSIPLNSKQDVVRNAFLELAKKYHPDSGSAEANIDKFVTIENAFRILTQHNTGYSSEEEVAQIVNDIKQTATQSQYFTYEAVDHDCYQRPLYQPQKQWEQELTPFVDFTTHKLNEVLLNKGSVPEWITMCQEIEKDIKFLKHEIRTERSYLGPHPLNELDEKKWNKICKDNKKRAQIINAKIKKYNLIVPLIDKQKLHVPFDFICDDILTNGNHSAVKQVVTKQESNVNTTGDLFSVLLKGLSESLAFSKENKKYNK